MEKIKVNRLPENTFKWVAVNYTNIDPIGTENFKYGNEHIIVGAELVQKNQDSVLKLPKDFEGVNRTILDRAIKEYNLKNTIIAEKGETKNVQINYMLNKENPELISNTEIHAMEDSTINVIYDYSDDEESEYLINNLANYKLEKNSTINIIKVQRNGKKTRHLEQRYIDVEEGAKYTFISVNIGSKEVITNTILDLKGDESEADAKTVYLAEGEELIDISQKMNFIGKKTNGELEIKGALNDKAKKYFRGTLDFKKGSAQSNGSEEEAVLLLSENVKSFAVPILLCHEDDVLGNHAAGAGQIEEEKLFYVMSRGFTLEQAKRLIIESSFRPIIDKIEDEELKEFLIERIHERLRLK